VLGGILGLALGAHWLVEGASGLALRLGVAPMMVGLIVVGFGTSMPEYSVSVLAAAHGSRGMSLGNAVGSNVMNLLLVLGAAALVRPLRVAGTRRGMVGDLLWGVAPALVILAGARHGALGRPVALALLALFLLFLVASVHRARSGRLEPVLGRGTLAGNAALTVVGIAVLVGGAEALVAGGVRLAEAYGVSEAVIGLTLVAFGTSLPELATSVVAAVRGEADISVGNVLGSNVFNLGLVVGTAFAIRPGPVPAFVVREDIPFLLVATLVVGAVVLRDGRVSRLEGAGMVGLFVAYLVFLAVRGGAP